MKSTFAIAAFAASVVATPYGYGPESSSSKVVSTSSKGYGYDHDWKPTSSSVKPKPTKTWGDDEDCDEWGNPIKKTSSSKKDDGHWPKTTTSSKKEDGWPAKPSSSAKWDAEKPSKDACAPYAVVKTIPGGVYTVTKTVEEGKDVVYTKTIPGKTYTTTVTESAGVTAWPEEKTYTTEKCETKTEYGKETVYTKTYTLTSTITVTKSAYKTATYTKSEKDSYSTVTKKGDDKVVTYTKTGDASVSTEWVKPCGDKPTEGWSKPTGGAAAPPKEDEWEKPTYTAKPVTSSKVYSPVLQTANAAVQNVMGGAAALVAAAAYLL